MGAKDDTIAELEYEIVCYEKTEEDREQDKQEREFYATIADIYSALASRRFTLGRPDAIDAEILASRVRNQYGICPRHHCG